MTTTTRKLSALIREGAAKRPQAFTTFFGWDVEREEATSCALGAAYEALAGLPTMPAAWDARLAQIRQTISAAVGYNIKTRLVGPDAEPVESLVIQLNDGVRLPREVIAERLEEMGL